MIQKSLNGKWKVSHIPYNTSIDDILSENFVPEGWLDANIPEEIHSTLRKAGIIKGHYYGKDVDEEKWIEEADWVYYKEFFVDEELKKEKVLLQFKGLDTFCDIYLNGIKIGSAENMHLGIEIDIKDKLNYGNRNVVIIRFYSPVKYVENMDKKGLYSTTTLDRILARKAQMNYSWDFCGRCVTTGIWQEVFIKSCEHNYIDSYYIYTKKIEEDSAVIALNTSVNTGVEISEGYTLSAVLEKDGKEVWSFSGDIDSFGELELTVANPKLWWPRPYGKAELYDFKLTLKRGEETVDERYQKFGIRTIDVIQEDQSDGKSFIFSVNGRRIFVRGANWVPINVVYTDITDKEYETYLDYAVEGNISMLRVWGGGIYENERFFELCDEKGIMVWNDFMFACGIYPQNDEFLSNVYKEAVYNIKKYRNYTSLVIWTGDNEDDEAYSWAGRPYEFFNDKVNKVTLKSAWQKYDPNRMFLPTSPCSPFEFYKGGDNPKSPYQGDTHLYLISAKPLAKDQPMRARDYYKNIKTYRPRFMSEFGFVSLPEKDTYYKFNFLKKPIEHGEWLKDNLPFWGELADKGDYDGAVYFSQVYNSYAFKYWIEYFRSLKWTCAGSLYWKFNDPIADTMKEAVFPTLMATVDMFKMPKMTFYYTKRSYEDVILVCEDTDEGYDIYSCSELQENLGGKLVISHLNFDGSLLYEKNLDTVIEADSSKVLYKLNFSELDIKDKYSEYIKVEFTAGEKVITNRYLFADIYEFDKLNFKSSGLKAARVYKDEENIYVTLKTDKYARNVRLNILDKKVSFEDNYFDMDAGSERTIRIAVKDWEGIKDTVLYIEGENVEKQSIVLAKV